MQLLFALRVSFEIVEEKTSLWRERSKEGLGVGVLLTAGSTLQRSVRLKLTRFAATEPNSHSFDREVTLMVIKS
jgi:hypothetical protein